MLDNLSPEMKKRLELWRKNTIPVKSAEIIRGKSPPNYRPIRGDYGDDTRDLDQLKKDNNER
jgi:hypothetical protein